jgi:hypothetical protein
MAWVTTRQSLMGGRVGEEIARMEPGKSDLVALVSNPAFATLRKGGKKLTVIDESGLQLLEGYLYGRVCAF